MNINQALSFFPKRDNDDDEDDGDKSDYKSDKKEEGPEINTNQLLSFLVVRTFIYKKVTEIQRKVKRNTNPSEEKYSKW